MHIWEYSSQVKTRKNPIKRKCETECANDFVHVWDKNELRFHKRHGSLSSTTTTTMTMRPDSIAAAAISRVLDDGDKL